jgi:hypothetical protein
LAVALRGSVRASASDQVPARGLGLALAPGLGLALAPGLALAAGLALALAAVPAPAQEAPELVVEVSARETGMV